MCLRYLPALLALSIGAAQPSCGLVSPLIKTRIHDTPPAVFRSPPAVYELSAARQEYESVQLICIGPLDGISVSVALPPSLAALLPPPQLHSSLYYANSAGNLSDCNARQGAWADPLVPFTDVFVGEERNRTTAVPADENRGFWVDFYVPRGAPAGTFLGGIVSVTATGITPLALPYTLRVRNFTLPDTSPFATAFGFTARGDDLAPNASAAAYAELGLMHRFTVSNAFTFAPELQQYPPDLAGFEANWGSFLTGRKLPFGLENTTVSAFQLPSPFCDRFENSSCGAAAINTSILYWRTLYEWAAERDLAGLLFDYTVRCFSVPLPFLSYGKYLMLNPVPSTRFGRRRSMSLSTPTRGANLLHAGLLYTLRLNLFVC